MNLEALNEFLHILANIIAASAILPLMLFVYFYATEPIPGRKLFGRWHWRRYARRWRFTAIGRVLMYQKIGWVIFLLFIVTHLFIPEYGIVEQVLRLIIYSGLVSLFWRVFYVLRQVQNTVEKDPNRGQNRDHLD